MHTPCKASLEHEKLFLNHQNPHLRDIRLAIGLFVSELTF